VTLGHSLGGSCKDCAGADAEGVTDSAPRITRRPLATRALLGLVSTAVGVIGGSAAGASTGSPHVTTAPAAHHAVSRPAAPRRVTLAPAETRLLSLVNTARKQQRLAPLAAAAGPTDVARRWSAQLVSTQLLAHDPALVRLMQGAGGGKWQWLAENVGEGPTGDVDALFAAYMASPHHRTNILDPRGRFIGIGTVDDGGGLSWNTMDFSDAYDDHYGPARTSAAG
jgi:uncharacterized protein YkwD